MKKARTNKCSKEPMKRYIKLPDRQGEIEEDKKSYREMKEETYRQRKRVTLTKMKDRREIQKTERQNDRPDNDGRQEDKDNDI